MATPSDTPPKRAPDRFAASRSKLSLLIALALAACSGTQSEDAPAVYEFEVTGEPFRIRLDGPARIAEAEAALAERRVGGNAGLR